MHEKNVRYLPSLQRYAKQIVVSFIWVGLLACATERPAVQQVVIAAPAQPKASATVHPVPTPQPPRAIVLPPSPPPVISSQPLPAPLDKAANLRRWTQQQARLYQVVAPVLIRNTELCPQHVRNLLGFTAKTRYSYSDEYSDIAQSELGLEERLRVMNVLPGSGAEQAGLQKGDILVSVEIEPLPQGPNAERLSASIIASEIQGRDRLGLSIIRNGERMRLNIPLTPACAMIVDLGNSDLANSFADGQRIMVTRGMLDQIPSDDELAYIMAREIAHNVISSQTRPETAAIIDYLHTLTPDPVKASVIDHMLPTPPQVQAHTDTLALYMLARAGYSAASAAEFWRQFSQTQHSSNANIYAHMHPMTAEHAQVLANTIQAIANKQQRGEPVAPDPS